jgi:Secretion system C-terminal sorting domain
MKHILTLLIVFATSYLYAQADLDKKRDYQWPIGYKYYQNGNLIDFNQQMKVFNFTKAVSTREYLGSICDKNGKLLFMTNGCSVYNRKFEIMENGDTLNPGIIYNSTCTDSYPGMRLNQAVMILPHKDENTYIIFHKVLDDEIVNFPSRPSIRLKYSIVDMTKGNGYGAVTVKNKVFLQDTMVSGELLACRHANGKDWWLLTPQWSVDETNSNQYYRFLITKDSIIGPYEQRIGVAPKGAYSHNASFSPDGTKYARIRAKQGLYLFDFDRSTGLLSNARPTIKLNKNAYSSGVAFSSDSRFLYASSDTILWQIDASAKDPDATKEIIAEYDGFLVNGSFASTFDAVRLAPDCKLYIVCQGTIEYLSVINYPNRKGKASGVEQHGLKLPTKVSWGLPNYPSFRLGALGEKHTPCDSTINPYISSDFKVTATEEASAPPITLAVYPNPVQDEVNVDLFGYVNRYKHGKWELYDIQGRQVATFPLIEGVSEYRFNIAILNDGMYYWRTIFDGKNGQSGKLIKME